MNTWDSKNSCTEPEDPYNDAVDVVMQMDGVSTSTLKESIVAVQPEAAQPRDGGLVQETVLVVSMPEADTILVQPRGGAVNSTNLTGATRRIIADLKNEPGSRYFTRLTQETTGEILRVAMDTVLF